MATKFKTKSVITRLVQELSLRCFAANMGFSGSGYRMLSVKFQETRLWLPWQRKLSQNGL